MMTTPAGVVLLNPDMENRGVCDVDEAIRTALDVSVNVKEGKAYLRSAESS